VCFFSAQWIDHPIWSLIGCVCCGGGLVVYFFGGL